MKRVLISLMAFLSLTAFADSRWEEARTAYDEGRFGEALETYLAFRDDKGTSAALEYNLGNTRFRLGQTDQALGHYRRAMWLDPSDPDLQANVDQALKLTGAEKTPMPLPRKLSGFFSPSTWRTVWISLCWLTALAGIACRLRPTLRPLAVWVLPLLVLGLGIFATGVWASRPGLMEQEAVLTGETVSARFEPLDDATVHFTLPSGSIVHIQDQTRTWYRISVDGNQGWVHQDQVLGLKTL